jgi:hypothetical protein
VSISFRPLGVWRLAVQPGIYSSARTLSAAKVRKQVPESILPLSERGSWAPPLEERGAGVSFSLRPLDVWRLAVQPGKFFIGASDWGHFSPGVVSRDQDLRQKSSIRLLVLWVY